MCYLQTKNHKNSNINVNCWGFSTLRIPFIQPNDTIITMISVILLASQVQAWGLLEGPWFDSDNFII